LAGNREKIPSSLPRSKSANGGAFSIGETCPSILTSATRLLAGATTVQTLSGCALIPARAACADHPMAVSAQSQPRPRQLLAPRHLAAIAAGNALEFYDFLTYAFFAIYIGRAFFPSSDPSASLLSSLATFGAGFVTRPIGSVVIGKMGDRVGRKPAMFLSFTLMGASIVGLALVPPYRRIGVAAPVLAIFFRVLQGFALGGEVGPTTAILLEASPIEHRGLFTSFQSATQSVATLAAGLVGFVLSNFLNEQQLQSYGWRVAFLLGALTVPFALIIRRSLPETLHETDAGAAESDAAQSRPYLIVAFIGVFILANGTIGTYIRTYMTTYAIATLHMPANIGFAATIVNGVFGTAFSFCSGALSDRVGRKPVMLVSSALLLALIFPSFYVMSHYRTTLTLLGATAILTILSTMSIIPMVTWLTESFPPGIRSSGLAITYAVSISAFGGTTQYAVAWLIKRTGSPLAPAWYWIVAAIIGLIAVLATHETAPRKLSNATATQHPAR
jgi:MHS family citrate/tricarballylate:H+ symporter-like MFS transporter